jgi:hypothetical protein
VDFNVFFEELGIKTPDACFVSVLNEACAEYQKNGVFFLEDAFIKGVNSCENCLSNCIDEVLVAAEQLRSDEKLAIYTLFSYRAMMQRKNFLENIDTFIFPDGEDAGRRMLPFIILLPEIQRLYEKLVKRQVPQDIIAATLRQFEACVILTEERTGKFGYLKRYFDHMQLYVDEMVLNIGRLRFQMVQELESDVLVLRNPLGETAVLFDGANINSAGRLYQTPPEAENSSCFTATVKESETAFTGFPADENGNCAASCREYPKETWKIALRKGDPVLSVHIPNTGAFKKEACEDSFRRAREVFSACYPEFVWKAFYCHSWMLDPQLHAFLPEHSNILAFQHYFTMFAGKTEGEDVFNFVFKLQFKEYQDMPEDTSLQRGLKKHYLNGKYIYEYEGIFFGIE